MTTTLKVEGMSCAHCVSHVKEALSEIVGVTAVQVTLENGQVVVEHADSVTHDAMKDAIEEAGYDLA